MIIRTYKKDSIVNLDNVLQIVLQGCAVNAIPVGSAFAITLGRYKTEERAAEVFEWTMKCIDSEKNMIMPEE